MTTSETQDGPFVAQDGLQYASKADRLLGRPIESSRNFNIRKIRAQGGSEALVQDYIRWYDAPAQDSDWGDVGCLSEA